MISSDHHTSVRRRRWPRRLGIASALIACALVGLWIYANHAARSRVAQQLTRSTGLPATVESAFIRWRGEVVARQIVLGPSDHPVATIDELVVQAPLKTLATTPDIQHVLVTGANLTLEVTDEEGLLWPQSTGQQTSFPPQGVQFEDVSLQLTQTTRTPWKVQNISGTLHQTAAGTLQFNLQAADVEAASWTMEGVIETSGQIHINAESSNFAFDPSRWENRPLVPTWIAQVPVDFRGNVKLSAELDAQKQPVVIDIEVANGDAQLLNSGQTLEHISANVRLQPNRIEIASLEASSETSQLSGHLTANTTSSSLMGEWQFQWSELSLNMLAENIPRLAGLSGRSNGELHGDFIGRNGTIRARCEGPVELANANYKEASLPDLTANIQLDQLRLSLRQPTDIAQWIISGKADCDSFLLAGEKFQHVTADLQLHERRLIVSGEATLNGAQSRYVFGLDTRLGDPESRGKVMFAGQQVSATSLFASAERISSSLTGHPLKVPQVAGEITFDAVFDVPSVALNDLSQWSGSIHAHAPSVTWNESRFDRLHLVGQMADAKFELTKGSATIGRTGSLQVVGEAPMTGDGDVMVTAAAQDIPLDDVLRLALAASSDRSSSWANALSQIKQTNTEDEGTSGGTVNWHGTMKAPRTQLADATRWNVDATVQLDHVVVYGEQIDRCKFDVALNDRTVQLKAVDVAFSPGGQLRGDVTFPLDASETARTTQMHVDWIAIPLSALDRFVPTGRETAGVTTGRLRVSGPANSWNDLRRLDGTARMIFQDVRLGSQLVGSYNAILELRPSEDVSAKFWNRQGTPKLQIQTTIGRESPYRVRADLLIVNTPFQDILPRDWLSDDRLQIQGHVSTRSRLTGTLAPLQLAAAGRANLKELIVGSESLPDMAIRFRTHPEQGTQLHLRAEGLGGVAEGHVDFPWITSRVPQAAITFRGIQAGQLQQLASSMLPREIELVGELSGKAHIVSWNDLDHLIAEVETEGITAQVRGIPINAMAFHFSRDDTLTQYTAQGNVLDGALTVAGQAPSSQTEWPAHVTIESARLDQLRQHNPRFRALEQLAGQVEINMDLSFDSKTQQIAGDGTVTARDVSWRRERVIPRAESHVTLQDGVLQFTDLEADVAQGVVSGRLSVPVTSTQLGSYELTARRVALHKTIRMLAPKEKTIQGTWSGRFSGSLGPNIVGRGELEMRNVTLNRVPLSTIRVPITYLVDTRSWDGRLTVQRAQARAAGGQLTADGVVSFGRQNDFKLTVDLARVDTGILTQNLTRSTSYDQGRLTGKLQLQARRFQSLRDLEGTFRGELEDANSMRLPVFSDLVSFANVTQLSREPFDSETLSLRISRGIISTPGVVLRSNGAEVFLQGQMDVNERLDFDVALQSGNVSPDFGLSELVRSPAATLAVPGVALPLQVLDFLQNRVLYLHVGGTVQNPSFQIRTDRQIQQELIRYYLPTMTLPASRTNP